MVCFPFCKINLGLHILGRRSDGYHDLETCFYPVPWTDVLEILPGRKLEFSTNGVAIPGKTENNSCLKAWQLLHDNYKIPPVEFFLYKVIPTGAGLGGGSSDGAFTLKSLNELFALGMTQEQLLKYAAELGSDCAFFLQDQPAIGTGRGEQLSASSLSLRGHHIIIVKPDVHIPTSEAYSMVTPSRPATPISEMVRTPIRQWKGSLVNDFEIPIFRKYSFLAELKNTLYATGAVFAGMSGSGSSVFGIFEKPAAVPEKYRSLVNFAGELKK